MSFRLQFIFVLLFIFWLGSLNASPVNVRVLKLKSQTVPIIADSIGALYATKHVTISPEVAGKIKSIDFQYGEPVNKGQTLFSLDDQLYKAQYLAAESDLHLSQLNYTRQLKLSKANAVAQKALDDALADLNDKKSALNVLKIKLAKMQIKAPFSGFISASQADVGQFVSVGESLATLVDKKHLTVRFSLPQRYWGQVKKGQVVRVKSHKGVVNYISPMIDPKTRTFMVWATLTNPKFALTPGLFVKVKLMLGKEKGVLLVPQTSLIPTIEGDSVYIVKNHQAMKKTVLVKQLFGSQAQITKGLKVGDVVVVQGQEKLSSGRSVKVVR